MNKPRPEMRDLASRLQQRVRDLAAQAAPGRGVEVRPEPERSCPRPGGCEATAIDVLLLTEGTGCAAVVSISKPGPSPQHLVPWIGQARLRQNTVPFREPPEAHIAVEDFVGCSTLIDTPGEHEAEIVQAIHSALP